MRHKNQKNAEISVEENRRILDLFERLRDVPVADRARGVAAANLSYAGHERLKRMFTLAESTASVLESLGITARTWRD